MDRLELHFGPQNLGNFACITTNFFLDLQLHTSNHLAYIRNKHILH